MPVVIISYESHDDRRMWPTKVAVFDGSMKQAKEWCESKNGNKNNWSTRYEPVKVGKLKPLWSK